MSGRDRRRSVLISSTVCGSKKEKGREKSSTGSGTRLHHILREGTVLCKTTEPRDAGHGPRAPPAAAMVAVTPRLLRPPAHPWAPSQPHSPNPHPLGLMAAPSGTRRKRACEGVSAGETCSCRVLMGAEVGRSCMKPSRQRMAASLRDSHRRVSDDSPGAPRR